MEKGGCSGSTEIGAICSILSNLAYNSFKGVDRGGSCFLCFVFHSYSSYLIGYWVDWFCLGQRAWQS
jgi:hypothetical protein